MVDSGGQYLGGTTDTTRTVHFGAPPPRQRAVCTHVLRGHVALAAALVPEVGWREPVLP